MLLGTWRSMKETLTAVRRWASSLVRMDILSSFWTFTLFQRVRASGHVHHREYWVSRLSLLSRIAVKITSLRCLLLHQIFSSVGYKVLEADDSNEMYDQIIFGVHAPAVLKILGAEATHDELRILGAFQYTNSDVYLHQDESLMPQSSSAWSARNFLGTTTNNAAGKAAVEGLLGKKCDLILMNAKLMVPSWSEAVARLLVTRFLDQYISVGILRLDEEGGNTFSFGKACKQCHVKCVLQVHDPLFYWKVATEADLGLADAYINGSLSLADHREGLLNLFLILIANRDSRPCNVDNKRSYIGRGWWTPLLLTAGIASIKYILSHVSRKNTITQSRRNILEHYDLSNNFFALFLDPTMNYSCGVFKVEDESLEVAQLRKVRVLINKANVERGHHVLEIGSGWGTLAIEVVRQTGCKYTGITLSEEQLKYAQRKVKEAGLLEDRITFLLCDYRQIPKCHKYDRIISCEMMEHVGHEYMDEFFSCCECHLAEYGLFVLQIDYILYFTLVKNGLLLSTLVSWLLSAFFVPGSKWTFTPGWIL